jgi:hypothetical protein
MMDGYVVGMATRPIRRKGQHRRLRPEPRSGRQPLTISRLSMPATRDFSGRMAKIVAACIPLDRCTELHNKMRTSS